MAYEIDKVPANKKSKIKHPILSEAGLIPKLNTSTIICGCSGSGKTVLLYNLLTRKEFFKNKFDKVFLFSPTGGIDEIQLALDIPKQRIFTDLSDAPKALDAIRKHQEKQIEEHGIDKTEKFCIIFDDCIGDTKFMNCKAFTNSFIKNRHYNCTVFFLTQYFKKLPKVCRLQANFLCFFAVSNIESECICAEFAPPGVSKREFLRLIDDTLTVKYDFLTINRASPWETRFKKGLSNVIDLNQYKSKRAKTETNATIPASFDQSSVTSVTDDSAPPKTTSFHPIHPPA